MHLRYTSLGSGSEGNALVVDAHDASGPCGRLLLDCGFGVKDLARRLLARGVEPESIDAMVITHEHTDHASGALRVARKFGLPIYGSHGTLAAICANVSETDANDLQLEVICSHTPFEIGAITLRPFPVPHDAREPTQFVFESGDVRLGVLTDAGRSTPLMIRMLAGCDALVLEFNHEEHLLSASAYPESLKRRIAGDFGHLSNAAAAVLLRSIDKTRLRRIHAAHLSQRNNSPELAREALCAALEGTAIEAGVATQEDGFEWVEL